MPSLPFRLLLIAIILVLTRNAAAEPHTYTVELPDLPDSLKPLLLSVSDCANLRSTPPDSTGLLRQRMRNDLRAFAAALDARGYFKADIDGRIDTTVAPIAIRFTIAPGPRFVFDDPTLDVIPADSPAAATARIMLKPIASGVPYASDLLINTEETIQRELKKNGYPFPRFTAREIVADHDTNRISVHLTLDPGPRAAFGQTVIQGLEHVDTSLVLRAQAWQQGDLYDSAKVDTTRENLIRTGLFRSVRIEPAAESDPATVTMRAELLEGPPRSIRAGLWYFTDQGPGITLGWTHRNLFGQGQELRLDTEVAQRLQSAKSSLLIPGVFQTTQNLEITTEAEHEDTDGYDTHNLSVSAMLHRKFSELQVGYGASYRYNLVEKDAMRTFNLVSVPLTAELTTTDNVLDPTSGLHVVVRLEPFTDVTLGGTSFVLWNVVASHYLPLTTDRTLTLATRGRYGMMAGASHDSVPEDMLLYAGGGSSIRGYAYQYAGKLDADGDPLGGVSAMDFSAELRWRFNQDFGFVLFGDGGGAFTNRNPGTQDTLFWGTGAGLRYYTPIGPVRLDAAIPLNRRPDVDAPFQLYISFGQAF